MIPRRARVLAVFALAVVALADGCSGHSHSATPASPRPSSAAVVPATAQRILEFNFCGNVCNNDDVHGPVDALIATLDSFRPDVVLLEEMCADQVAAIEQRSATNGNWQVYGAMDDDLPGGCADGSDNFGDAILSHHPLSPGGRVEESIGGISPPGVEQRKVMCVRAMLSRSTEVCVTHIGLATYVTKTVQADEIHQATTFALAREADVPVILGGDFNAVPTDPGLDATYRRFDEIAQCPGSSGRSASNAICNQVTHPEDGRKIDYIFLEHGFFSDFLATVTHTVASDHYLLKGTFQES